MKTIVRISIVFVLTALVSGTIGYRCGKTDATIEDFKIYRAWLIGYYGFTETNSVTLADFLKARYYYTANRMPTSALGEPYDFGDVDFIGSTIGAEETTPSREYELFKAKKVKFQKPFEASNSVTNN